MPSACKTLERHALADKVSCYSIEVIPCFRCARLKISCVVSARDTPKRLSYKAYIRLNVCGSCNISGVTVSASMWPCMFLVCGLTTSSAIR